MPAATAHDFQELEVDTKAQPLATSSERAGFSEVSDWERFAAARANDAKAR